MGYSGFHYTAHTPDQNGCVNYSKDENAVWAELYARQIQLVQRAACPEFLEGLDRLHLPPQRIPQIPEINSVLIKTTGWSVTPVPALISFDRFFDLLAHRQFPAATFIRKPEELDYLKEPDIFHEIFGHCPLLTHQVYADFMAAYGALGVGASKAVQTLLARLYWFTIEFGLIQTPEGLRCYGGGILSSIGETTYALKDEKPLRKKLDLLEALRTPYRIDLYQTVYFVIESLQDLYRITPSELLNAIRTAEQLGDFEPTYPLKNDTEKKNSYEHQDVSC